MCVQGRGAAGFRSGVEFVRNFHQASTKPSFPTMTDVGCWLRNSPSIQLGDVWILSASFPSGISPKRFTKEQPGVITTAPAIAPPKSARRVHFATGLCLNGSCIAAEKGFNDGFPLMLLQAPFPADL